MANRNRVQEGRKSLGMDGKREPFKTKDSNRIQCTGEQKKKKLLAIGSKVSVADKFSSLGVSLIAKRGRVPEVPVHQVQLNINAGRGTCLSEQWVEELVQAMKALNMHIEQEYALDIFTGMMVSQSCQTFRSSDIPKAVTAEMRTVLVDWLVQVHEYLGLEEETLYLAVYLMNSYLKVHKIHTALLQLLAASCLFLASKIEERLIPEPAELCFMMEDAFSKKELLKMERKILSRLKFELHYIHPLHFLRILSTIGKCPMKILYLAMYFMELTLLEAEGSMIEPALLAIGALSLAQRVSLESGSLTSDEMWHGVQQYFSYSDAQLINCQHLMAKAALRAGSMENKSTWHKYSRPQKLGVSSGSSMSNSKHLARCMRTLSTQL
uniref:Cyclin N-terminal domain-containing protein n=1 Tax=Xenopus tropicalis TaxID=8364 RepID=A0A803J3R4_XENTR